MFLAVSQVSLSPVTAGNTVIVPIANSTFLPRVLNINVGQTITWVNNDSTAHTVTSDGNFFDSGIIPPDSSFSYTFVNVGTYYYHSADFPSETGIVFVNELKQEFVSPTVGNIVLMTNFTYSPSVMNVIQGQTVTWINKDSAAHTVTLDNGSFGSVSIMANESFSYTFNNLGRFDYHDSLNPSMEGTINVTTDGKAPTPAVSQIPYTAPVYEGTVSIVNYSFNPAVINIKRGQIVSWVNNDVWAHTVTFDNGLSNSGAISPRNSYSHTFMSPGIRTYHDALNPSLRGTIIVSE